MSGTSNPSAVLSMTDTLVVLATLGSNAALWMEAVIALREHATIPFALFVILDGGTETQVAWLREQRAVGIDVCPLRRGLVPAYNVGFRYFLQHTYTYLHLLEEGVTVTPGWDTALRRTLDAHPDFGWVACTQEENPKTRFTAYCSLLHREAVTK